MTLPHSSPTPSDRSAKPRETTFADRLSSLTRAVSAPPVIGETRAWCSRIADELGKLAMRRDRRQDRHDELRDELAEARPVESDRLDDMGDREHELGLELTALRNRFEELAREDDRVGFDEPYQQAKKLRDELLEWCVAARAMDADLRSRVMETHYRDRGTVD